VPDTTIDSVSVSAGGAATSGQSVAYSVTVSGDATPFTYLWGVSAGGSITGGQGTTSATILWNATGSQGVTCAVSSSNANFDGNDVSDTLTVTVAAPAPATGPADSVTLVGDTTTQGSGSVAATATTSASGSGLTVTYDSDGATATNLAIAEAGSGYEEGDSFTVDGDTGVTGTVSIASLLTANAVQAGVSHVVTQAGGDYYIDGVANAEVTATAGQTIYFDLSDASLSGHPFKIYTDASKTLEVTVGVASDANGLIFTPPIAGSFSYQCASHAGMGGDITVS
jgi:plastocyanin